MTTGHHRARLPADAPARARARAVRLGAGVTVQHPLLYSPGGNLVRYWGPDRASQVMPVRAWVEEGALTSASRSCSRVALLVGVSAETPGAIAWDVSAETSLRRRPR